MKSTNRFAMFATALLLCAVGISISSIGARAQDDTWQLVRADYGYRNQRNDVTEILKDLIQRGGVEGRVAVNNQTMGGDPAKGRDKTLHIVARNRRREEREFNYNEGSYLDARMFNLRRDEWDDRPTNNASRNQDDGNEFKIIRAYYGVQGKTANVTDLLRTRVRDGALSLTVTNREMGGDPAVSYDKTLIVIYRFQGRETATVVREGDTLTIP